MRDGFRNITHSLFSLLLGLQLINISIDTSRCLSYAFHSHPQIKSSSENNRMEDFVDFLLGINLETDNTSPESDESETDREQNEVLDFLYTHPDTIKLSPILSSGKGVLNRLFAANLESIVLDTTSPPPKS